MLLLSGIHFVVYQAGVSNHLFGDLFLGSDLVFLPYFFLGAGGTTAGVLGNNMLLGLGNIDLMPRILLIIFYGSIEVGSGLRVVFVCHMMVGGALALIILVNNVLSCGFR